MKCVICKKGPKEGLSIFRINAKGVDGLWACEKHLAQTDGPPIDPVVKKVVNALEKK